GAPPLRPLWSEFPEDENTFGIDNSYMVGGSLLVHPVVEAGATTATVYFPAGLWYDVQDWNVINGPASVTVNAPREKIPVYQHGGTIVSRKDRIRRASSLMRDDPYTLYVALDASGSAQGTLYIDDEHTFDYRKGKFLYLKLKFENGVLQSSKLDPNGTYKTKSWLERVVIVGIKNKPSKISLNTASGGIKSMESVFEDGSGDIVSTLVIRKPAVNMGEEFSITIE
ncbi:unnamed protein product, partial [Meganyctiphanes norvegica]